MKKLSEIQLRYFILSEAPAVPFSYAGKNSTKNNQITVLRYGKAEGGDLVIFRKDAFLVLEELEKTK